MRDRGLIYAGLAVLVGVLTLPMWRAAATHAGTTGPELKPPEGARHCVAPVDYMRSSHMKLLLDWRDAYVRHQQRQFTAFDGRTYLISMESTCLGCHDKAQFCDGCHTYAGVKEPYCWSCHQSRMVARSTP